MTDAVARFLASGEVGWEGNETGLMPYLAPDAEEAAASLRPEDAPALVDALGDEQRFVRAHVGLTRVCGVRYESFPTWNGLEVTLRADGGASIDPAQREALAGRWRRWLQGDPRPPALPPAG